MVRPRTASLDRFARSGRRLYADAAAMFLLAGLSTFATGDRASASEGVDTAIVFVVDVSESMDSDERDIVRRSHAQALLSPEVMDLLAARRFAFAYVEFSTTAAVKVGWALVDSEDSARAFVARLVLPGVTVSHKSTSISAGMLVADTLFDDLPWQADRLVVDIVGDGRNNTRLPLAPARQRLLDRGVVINGVPLTIRPQEHGLEHIYRHEVIGGTGAFYIPLLPGESDIQATHGILGMQRFPGLPSVLRQKLLKELL